MTPIPASGSIAVTDRESAVRATVDLVKGARRHIRILSRLLDPGLYDDPRVLEALRAFATSTSDAGVRLLVHDATAIQRAHAPLLGLAQRLPSVFEFRELADPVDRARADAFITTDGGGCYHREFGHRFDGEAMPSGAGRARQLAEAFDPVWERSRPCTELRTLGL
ncbi:MAG: hypothetical protein GX856_08020 [Gammaproteobacteria bacterium]|jgi:phosphatidylserine/phosphatidylglycerophosphate/cardiolipin synthase-like enzyme|nr:hypothetical protein [Gammaproteobacteria bacterium]